MIEDITVAELLELFDKALERNVWGNYSYIEFQSDGSGMVMNDYDNPIFSFENIEELVERLRK